MEAIEPYWSWWTKLGLLPSSVSVLISDSRASDPGTPADQRELHFKPETSEAYCVYVGACDMKHSGRNLLGVAPTPGEAIQQRHLHLEVGEHLNNVDVKQERFHRHPAEGSQVEKLQEQGNCDTGGLNGEKGGEISVS